MVWSNLDIFLVLSRDQETLRLIDAFHYLCVIIYNYAIKYNCSKKRPSPPSCTFYSEPKNLKKFWLVNFLPRIVLDVLDIKLQYILFIQQAKPVELVYCHCHCHFLVSSPLWVHTLVSCLVCFSNCQEGTHESKNKINELFGLANQLYDLFLC